MSSEQCAGGRTRYLSHAQPQGLMRKDKSNGGKGEPQAGVVWQAGYKLSFLSKLGDKRPPLRGHAPLQKALPDKTPRPSSSQRAPRTMCSGN